MKQKSVKFDLSADALLDIAESKLDEGDNLAALRVLHKSLELYGDAPDEYAELADAYEGMELYERAAESWFRFLDVCAEEEMVEGYEGLAACYYNLGNREQASHYYERMMHDRFVTPANNLEMSELFEAPPRIPLRVTWPPEYADYSEEIDEGLKALKAGELSRAEQCFKEVHPDSEHRIAALNYLAVCYLLANKSKEAEQTCRELLERVPDSVQALATYAAVLAEQGRQEEGRAVAEHLSRLPADNADDLYKIATVCCENGLYRAAYERFCTLEEQVPYDHTLLYFKAIAAFRCGEVRQSLTTFSKILDIYPEAAVARYYFRAVRAYAEEGGTPPETAFFYRVPLAEREERVRFLQTLRSLRAADLAAYCLETDISELLEWCYDENDGQDAELQLLAASVAVHAGLPFVRAILLSPTVADVVKAETVRMLAECNRNFEYGVVLSQDYLSVQFEKLTVARASRAKFVQAYALCFARFALFGAGEGENYRVAAQAVYAALSGAGMLGSVADAPSLACALYLTVNAATVQKAQEAMQLVGAEPTKVAAILQALRTIHAAAEAAAADASHGGEEGQQTSDAPAGGGAAEEDPTEEGS